MSFQGRSLFLVLAFGLIGILARYLIVTWSVGRQPNLPLATMIVNMSGSFLIGLVFALAVQASLINEEFLKAAVIGLLGGFTTFSSFSWEVFTMLNEGFILRGILYAVLAPALGVLLSAGGYTAGIFFVRILR